MKKLLTVITSILILSLSIGNVSLAKEEVKTTAVVYIGDSRTTGMDKAVNLSKKEDTFVIAKSGIGYNWFMKTGSEELQKIREGYHNYNNWVYVFNLGVNDLKNIDNYKNLIRELQKEATVYFVSINPTDDSVGGVQCVDIEEFNSQIYRIIGINNYINSYDYLEKVNGYNFDKRQDGMHYDEETYIKLYEFIDMGVKVHEFVKDNDDNYSAYFYLYNFK